MVGVEPQRHSVRLFTGNPGADSLDRVELVMAFENAFVAVAGRRCRKARDRSRCRLVG